MGCTLKRILLVVTGYLVLFFYSFAQQDVNMKQGWALLPSILARITPPAFPDKIFDVTKYGAIGNGKTDCTKAFKKAIEACNKAGGGMVFVPEGEYLTGAIHLKSNVNLHLAKNAVIKFSTNPEKYLPVVYVRWEGVECYNYSPLIYAFEQENIAVTGEGVLDGQGADDNWWQWKGSSKGKSGETKYTQAEARKKLFDMAEKGVPVEKRVFGKGYYLRPNFFVPYKCKNVLVQGVTFRNSPMWFLNPVLCKNVSIIGVKLEGLGPNNDGCDPESCTDVLIKDCFFNNGDDCIAIKSGRNADGRRVNVPCENIVIQGCKMKDGHGGIVIGSEMSGGVRNVYAENCEMDSPNLDRMLRIKTNSIRGGFVENVLVRNIKVGQVAEAIVKIDFYYEEGDKGDFTPVVRNIKVENVTSEKSEYALWIKAYERSPAMNIIVKDCVFNNVKEPSVIENVENLSIINVAINYY